MLIEIPSFTWTISNYILWNTYVFEFDNIPQQFVKKKSVVDWRKKKIHCGSNCLINEPEPQ